MINKRKLYFLSLCGLLAVAIFYACNVFFLYQINEETAIKNDIIDIEKYIFDKVNQLEPNYFNVNPRENLIRLKLLKNFKYSEYDNNVFEIANNWTNYDYGVYNPNDLSVGKVLNALSHDPIVNVTNASKGTQLKLVLHLQSLKKVFFKPQWYSRNTIINGSVYAGKDRHNAEIYSFYLAAALNISWNPLVVGRKINLKEVYEKGDLILKKTMFTSNTNNSNQYCLYGKCFYCKKTEHVCGDSKNLLEGAVILLIPGILKKERSPWQRSYKYNVKAKWEENMNFCKDNLMHTIDRNKLLDFIDVSIFDFLIQNGDRHHNEFLKGKLIFLDNGKSFGNPYKHFFDILAPLYQCCIIRSTTWNNLQIVSGGILTKLVDEILKYDELSELITEKHKKAVEERLILIYATVNYCIENFGKESVII